MSTGRICKEMLSTNQFWFLDTAAKKTRQNGRRPPRGRLLPLFNDNMVFQNHNLQQLLATLKEEKKRIIHFNISTWEQEQWTKWDNFSKWNQYTNSTRSAKRMFYGPTTFKQSIYLSIYLYIYIYFKLLKIFLTINILSWGFINVKASCINPKHSHSY